jgi:hypothetical protein
MCNRTNSRILAAITIGILAFMISTAANAATSWSYQGKNTGGPTFNRPNANGLALSGRIVPYQAQPFYLDSQDDCVFYSAQNYDGYLHLYQNTFDPSSPLLNLVAGDDDGALGAGTSELPQTTLTAGRTYILVTSSFASNLSGIFENTIHCDGNNTVIVHGDCTNIDDGTAGCLKEDRFEFTVSWVDFEGQTGSGTVSPFGATDSANVYFFAPDNWEMLIKVIDFCSDPNKNSYAVYFSATTNVQFRLQIRDTETGRIQTYENRLGNTADTVIDDFAFPCN